MHCKEEMLKRCDESINYMRDKLVKCIDDNIKYGNPVLHDNLKMLECNINLLIQSRKVIYSSKT